MASSSSCCCTAAVLVGGSTARVDTWPMVPATPPLLPSQAGFDGGQNATCHVFASFTRSFPVGLVENAQPASPPCDAGVWLNTAKYAVAASAGELPVCPFMPHT